MTPIPWLTPCATGFWRSVMTDKKPTEPVCGTCFGNGYIRIKEGKQPWPKIPCPDCKPAPEPEQQEPRQEVVFEYTQVDQPTVTHVFGVSISITPEQVQLGRELVREFDKRSQLLADNEIAFLLRDWVEDICGGR